MAKLRIFTVLALLFGVLGTVNAQTLDGGKSCAGW